MTSNECLVLYNCCLVRATSPSRSTTLRIYHSSVSTYPKSSHIFQIMDFFRFWPPSRLINWRDCSNCFKGSTRATRSISWENCCSISTGTWTCWRTRSCASIWTNTWRSMVDLRIRYRRLWKLERNASCKGNKKSSASWKGKLRLYNRKGSLMLRNA